MDALKLFDKLEELQKDNLKSLRETARSRRERAQRLRKMAERFPDSSNRYREMADRLDAYAQEQEEDICYLEKGEPPMNAIKFLQEKGMA